MFSSAAHRGLKPTATIGGRYATNLSELNTNLRRIGRSGNPTTNITTQNSSSFHVVARRQDNRKATPNQGRRPIRRSPYRTLPIGKIPCGAMSCANERSKYTPSGGCSGEICRKIRLCGCKVIDLFVCSALIKDTAGVGPRHVVGPWRFSGLCAGSGRASFRHRLSRTTSRILRRTEFIPFA